MFIDRYIDETPFLKPATKSLSRCLLAYSGEENAILEEKFRELSDVYCYSDSEDELESNKTLKAIASSLKSSFLKRKILSH